MESIGVSSFAFNQNKKSSPAPRRSHASCAHRHSKGWRVVRGDRSVTVGVIFMGVLCAHILDPEVVGLAIGRRAGPWRVEDVGVFYGELNLQALALIVLVNAGGLGRGQRGQPTDRRAIALARRLCLRVTDQPITLDHV